MRCEDIPENDEICLFNSLINAVIMETIHGIPDEKVDELRNIFLKVLRDTEQKYSWGKTVAKWKPSPCPLCGSKAELMEQENVAGPNYYSVGCVKCGVSLEDKGLDFGIPKAVWKWNERVLDDRLIESVIKHLERDGTADGELLAGVLFLKTLV